MTRVFNRLFKREYNEILSACRLDNTSQKVSRALVLQWIKDAHSRVWLKNENSILSVVRIYIQRPAKEYPWVEKAKPGSKTSDTETKNQDENCLTTSETSQIDAPPIIGVDSLLSTGSHDNEWNRFRGPKRFLTTHAVDTLCQNVIRAYRLLSRAENEIVFLNTGMTRLMLGFNHPTDHLLI